MTDWPEWNQDIEKRRAMSKLPPLPLKSTQQTGPRMHCCLAQVFDADGNAVASIESTDDPAQATELAALFAEAPGLRQRIAELEKEPVAWPVMPPSLGQSNVLFEDGYAEGWGKCLDAFKTLYPLTQPVPLSEVQKLSELYIGLTEAMGYGSGKDGIEWSPEEWAAHLLTAYKKQTVTLSEREAFEEWWGSPPTELKPLEPRTQKETLSACVWMAWKARAALGIKEKSRATTHTKEKP
jgi:hypothetical protein